MGNALIEANIVTRHRIRVNRPIFYVFHIAKHVDRLNRGNREIHAYP